MRFSAPRSPNISAQTWGRKADRTWRKNDRVIQAVDELGAEEPLDLAAAPGLVGPGVDQGDIERGAHDLQVLGPIRRAVVAIQSSGHSAAQHRLLETVGEARGTLAAVEGRERDDARGIVDQGVQVGLGAAPAGDQQAGTVHDVGHPQVASVLRKRYTVLRGRRTVSPGG